MSPTAACVAENLTVGYRDRRRLLPVLTDLELQLRPGSLTCLLGANGSGKSTLLRTFGRAAGPAARAVAPARPRRRRPRSP